MWTHQLGRTVLVPPHTIGQVVSKDLKGVGQEIRDLRDSRSGAWASRSVAASPNMSKHLRGHAGTATANGALAQAAAQRCARCKWGCHYDGEVFPASSADAADPVHVSSHTVGQDVASFCKGF